MILFYKIHIYVTWLFDHLIFNVFLFYSFRQIMENAKEFENASMREHLLLALSNSHILTSNSHHNHLPRVKSRELFSSPTRQSVADPSTNMNESDLWLIILKCHQSQDPPGALLNASQSTKSPVLTVLAACYEVRSRWAIPCRKFLFKNIG